MVTSTRCGASGLPKALRTSLLEKANCARRFEEKPHLKKLHGRSDVSSVRAAEDVEAENKGSVLGGFGIWPG